ncbi:MAG TPA: hypothetical protein V6C97_26815 [Oculatellaceae cyanobacterium]
MDIIWGVGLFVGILLAINNMAGGKATYVLQPFVNLVVGLLSMLVNVILQVLHIGVTAGTNALKTSRRLKDDRTQDQTSTPPRW